MLVDVSPSLYATGAVVAFIAAYYRIRFHAPNIQMRAHSRALNGFRVTDVGLVLTIPRRGGAAKPAAKELAIYITLKG